MKIEIEKGFRFRLQFWKAFGFLAKQNFNVYGIDIAKAKIKIAKDWLKKKG